MLTNHEEMDENVIAVAMYKLRDVEEVSSVERIIIEGPPTPYPLIGFDPIANAGISLKINGISTFLPYEHARDMCSLQFGKQIAENFIKKLLYKDI